MDAVLFDMDGVLVDSPKYERRTLRELFDTLGVGNVSVDELVGLHVVEKYRYLASHENVAVSEGRFVEEGHTHAKKMYTEEVRLLPSFPEIRHAIETKGAKAGVVSSSNQWRVDLVLDRFGLHEAFETVVSVDHISGSGKPDPEIYHYAADELGVACTDCVCVEDSEVGVAAGEEAGMYCIGYRSPESPYQDLSSADEVVDTPESLRRSTVEMLGD